MKINYVKLQDESEVECVRKFLTIFNELHLTHFENPIKNPIQNEVDVFCYDAQTHECLKIQIKAADGYMVGNLAKSREIPLEERSLIIRDHNQAVGRISNNINQVEEKYLQQGKDMSNIVLLFDEMMDPPKLILQEIKSKIIKSNFKEIWLVTRTNKVYRLY